MTIGRFYLKSIRRKFFNKPLFPLISVLGLTTGFVATVLVTVWLRDELSYDSYNTKSDRIYRLTVEQNNDETGFHWNFARSWMGWLKNIKKDIPGIETMVRLSRWEDGYIKANDNIWVEDIFYADPSIDKIFTFNFLEGNPETCLSQPGQVIISQGMARKFFGTGKTIGQTIFLYCSRCLQQKPFLVTGVFADTPVNSHIHFDLVASREKPEDDAGWAYYYLLLQKNTPPADILAKFNAFAGKYASPEQLATFTPRLQNIIDIHLHSSKDREIEKNGSIEQIYIVAGLALFVLFITLFNFFTLRYVSLIKEFKSVQLFRFAGAKTRSMYGYQALEALVYGVASALISFFVVGFMYKDFNLLIGKQEAAGSSTIVGTSLITLAVLIIITILTGLLPYVTIRTSRFVKNKINRQPALSSTGYFPSVRRSGTLKSMLGVQYISTFVLIICVIVINDQLRLFNKYRLGNKMEKLLCIQEIPCQVINKYRLFKEELLRSPLIRDITSSMEDPGYEIEDMMGFETTGIDHDTGKKLIYVCPVDDNFFTFYGIKLAAGSEFPKFTGNDSIPENYILNEEAVKYLGWPNDEEAIGKPFHLENPYISSKPGRIVGVVKNFQPSSVKKGIKPYVFFQKSFWLFSAQVKYDTAQQAKSLSLIRKTWDKIYPDFPLQYQFVGDLYKSVYKNEFQLRNIGTVLCLMAILLSALGLFGMTGIVYEARTKEIGIRKVNGAKFGQITTWLLRDILAVVIMALIFAVPVAWYIMQQWLQNYTYRVSISIWVFLLGGFIITGIALLTVSFQTWKAAMRNPVEALRYE